MNELISVIVPIYNAEQYLNRCLESLSKQTYGNFEAILINDGSTDNSLTICQHYEQKDNRFKIINKINEGVSEARNSGLDIASGDYITFLDSDDYLIENAFEIFINNLSDNKALYFFDYKIFHNGNLIHEIPQKSSYVDFETLISDIIYSYKNHFLSHSPWSKFYRKDLIDNVRFSNHIYIGEDLCFLLSCIKKIFSINEIEIINVTVYVYCYNDTSISNKYKKDYLNQCIYLFNEINKLITNIDSKKINSSLCNATWDCLLNLCKNSKKAFETSNFDFIKFYYSFYNMLYCKNIDYSLLTKLAKIGNTFSFLKPNALYKIFMLMITILDL